MHVKKYIFHKKKQNKKKPPRTPRENNAQEFIDNAAEAGNQESSFKKPFNYQGKGCFLFFFPLD